MVFPWRSRRVSFVFLTMAAVLTASSIAIAQEKPEEKPPTPSAAVTPHNVATPTTPDSTTEGSVTVGGQAIAYRAIAGTVTVGGSHLALEHIFCLAVECLYFADDPKRTL
jgi:carboxypeptidase C (cathepsin A)